LVLAVHDSSQSSDGSVPSEHKRSYQPSSKSSDQTAVATAPVERLAPRAEVDSFSDEDLELCVVVPSCPPTEVGVGSGAVNAAVENEVLPAADVSLCDENQNLDSSGNINYR